MQQETLDAIMVMLNGLGIPPGTDPDALISAYALAAHGVCEDCVRHTAAAFTRGELQLKGYRKGRAPATDLFAEACREEQARRQVREARAKRLKAEQHETAAEAVKPQDRTRMVDLMQTLQQALRGASAAQKALEAHGWNGWKHRYEGGINGPIVARGVSMSDYVAGCKQKRWPAGSRYRAIAGLVYQPEAGA